MDAYCVTLVLANKQGNGILSCKGLRALPLQLSRFAVFCTASISNVISIHPQLDLELVKLEPDVE